MSDIIKISINGVVYEIKDMIARFVISELQKEGFLKAENIVDNLTDTNNDAYIKNNPVIPTKAKQIAVEDSENMFEAANVEDVLKELFKYIKRVEDKIGSQGGDTEPIIYTIINNLIKCSTNNSNTTITKNAKYTAILTANSGYEIKSITVTMGGVDITSSVVNKNVIDIPQVTGNIVVTVQSEATNYAITNDLSNCSNSNKATSANKGSSYNAILTANSGYVMSTIKVTMGGTDITSSAVTPIIEGSEDSKTYSVTNNLSNCNNSNSVKSIREGDTYNSTITANSGYEIKSVKVTMGEVDIINDVVDENIIDINIPSVTGNIVITVSASAIFSGGDDEEDTNMIPKMTYGKSINQTTAVIESNPKCWATVNPVTVIVGQTYTISCDAPWVWVYGFDEADNYTSQLVLGTNEVLQNFTFTADTTKIRFGCYDPNKQLTYCTLIKQDSSGNTPLPPITGGDGDTNHISIVAINPVSISNNYATGEMIPDRGTGITNLTVSKGQSFDILYCTNMPAVKHELSWDNGANYSNQTGAIKVSNSVCYKYQHNASSSVNSYNMAIRVTDANGKTDTKSFVIKFI